MHPKLLSLKLLSKKIPRNLSPPSVAFQSISQNTSLALPRANPIHLRSFHPQQTHQFFSQYKTNASLPWVSSNGISKKISGFLSNPILVKQFSGNGLFKPPNDSLVGSRVGFLKAQFQRRGYYNRPWYQLNTSGWQSRLRRLDPHNLVIGLVLTNVAVFMLWRIADSEFMVKNFTISVENFRNGRVHTIVTSAFSHMDSWHLISNMIGLYFFGMSIANDFGPAFFLKLYFSGAVAGSVFFLAYHAFLAQSAKSKGMWYKDPSRTLSMGASGAVNAVLLLDILLFPKKTLLVNFIIPVPAVLLGIYLIGKDILRIIEGDPQISGSTHLGGATVAAITWMRMRRGRF